MEATDLQRLSLSPPLRVGLRVLFAAARRLGLDNRLFCLAHADSASPSEYSN